MLNEYTQDLTEEGLIECNGIIVERLADSLDFSYLVFLEDRPATERFVFVSKAAYEDPVRCTGSKSENTRLAQKADLYAVCDPVKVWFRPGSNYQTRVVLSPPEQDGSIRCYAEGFGEVTIRKEEQFRKCFPNVAYYANVLIKIDVSDLSSLDVTPSATAEYFLEEITDSPVNQLSAVVTEEVNPMLHTYRAREIQTTLCRLAPWNADFKHSDTAFYDYEDRKWYMVFDPNPSKGKEHVRARAVIIDEAGRTAFCRRHPDNLVLLADFHRKIKFGIGQWIAAHFFYSPICKQWVAVSCGPETEFSDVHEPIETITMELPHNGEKFTAFKLDVCRSEVVSMKTKHGMVRCRYGGLIICPLLSVIDGDKHFWCVIADLDEIFAGLNQDRATVWARFAGVEQAAKFVIVGVASDNMPHELPTRIGGEGVYLGGDGQTIYPLAHPSCTVHTPALFSTTISPGDRVTFFAVWNDQMQVYVAIKVEKNAEDLPMKVLQSERGPIIRLTAHRLSERAFYHADLGLIADPQRRIKLKARKLSKEELRDDRETFYVAIDHHVNATTYFKAISKKRPRELVQCARGPTLADRPTLPDTAQKDHLVGELRDLGDALLSSQNRRQLTAGNIRRPWFDLIADADNLPGNSS